MMQTPLSTDLVQKTVEFHGHSCPGLALGMRAAELALREVGKAPDEEVVAVVETDMCAVDAIQFLTGCTFGKGNLIHLDYGKSAFTFYRRRDGKALRIVLRPEATRRPDDAMSTLRRKQAREGLREEEEKRLREETGAQIRHIMEARLEDLFEIKPAPRPVPDKARILEGLICQACGEKTMESRTRRFQGQTLCIPCFEAMEKRI